MLEIVLFDQPCLLTTPSTVLCIHAALVAHARAQYRYNGYLSHNLYLLKLWHTSQGMVPWVWFTLFLTCTTHAAIPVHSACEVAAVQFLMRSSLNNSPNCKNP